MPTKEIDMADPVKIGEAARRAGFTVKALRYYDLQGLLPPSARSSSGYRLYDDADLHRLEFIRQAKALGLALAEIRQLVGAARSRDAATRPRLRRVLGEHIARITHQIAMLTRLRQELKQRRRNLPRSRPGDAGYCSCLRPAGKGPVTRELPMRRNGRSGREGRAQTA
jgi:DNA-binding transcriptional MerR regulator